MQNTLLYFAQADMCRAKSRDWISFSWQFQKKVLISGATDSSSSAAASTMVDAIENGVDNVDRRYTEQVLRAALKKLKDES